jgi:tetratricopeptide (TPR) repeat protein
VDAVRRAAADPGRRDAVCRSVIRACQDFLIRGVRQPLAWLQALRAESTELEALRRLANAMPSASIELREVALALTQTIVERAKALPNSATQQAFLATSLNNLSIRLSDLGRREPALAAIEEAVGIRRNLAAARPDAFLPVLAGSLDNLSNSLSDLGRREPALAAIEEAVGILRDLAAARPDAFLPDLATSLKNLSNRLSDLGRREPALAAIEEAVGILRKLAAARPDAFLPVLAKGLGMLGMVLIGQDDRRAAQSFAEALSLLRPAALSLPDAFGPLMATLVRDYLAACEAARTAPQVNLLASVLPIVQPFLSPPETR